MSIHLPCGCKVESYDNTVDIRMKSETLNHFEGFRPAVEYFTVCNTCYESRYSKYPDLILTDEEEENYLSEDWR